MSAAMIIEIKVGECGEDYVENAPVVLGWLKAGEGSDLMKWAGVFVKSYFCLS